MNSSNLLAISEIGTPLGVMLAVCDNTALYLLEFKDKKTVETQIEKLCKQAGTKLIHQQLPIHTTLKHELDLYFQGQLKSFTTPCALEGTSFQKRVWQELMTIPPGQTRSYQDLAQQLGNPKACRAVARANSTNRLAIIIPCHRVINKDGQLGGYTGGIARKDWLLTHEKKLRAGKKIGF